MSAVLGMMGQSQKGFETGIWHRVALNTIVRKGVKLDSERLKILPMGAKVLVMEQKERRVRISQPIAGWCSLYSSNGDTILSVLANKSEPGDIFQAQIAAAENLESKHKERLNHIEGVINHAKLSSDVNIKDMANELEDLKTQVQEAQSAKEKQKFELNALRSENESDEAHIQNSEADLLKLDERLQSVMNQLSVSGDDELQRLVNQHDVTEYEIDSLQKDLDMKQKLAERMQEEIDRLNKRLKNNFFTAEDDASEKKQDSEYVFRPGDVLQTNRTAPTGSEIVIIKYFGNPPLEVRKHLTCPDEVRHRIIDAEGLIGVQRDAPWEGVTCDGDGLFSAKENCAFWMTPDMVKQIITPKQLLHQLVKYVGSLVQNRTSAE